MTKGLTYEVPEGARCSLCQELAVYHVYRALGGINEADACEEHREAVIDKLTIRPRWQRIGGKPGMRPWSGGPNRPSGPRPKGFQ